MPDALPHKWDLADKFPEGFYHKDLLDVLQKAKQSTFDKTPDFDPLCPKQVEKIDQREPGTLSSNSDAHFKAKDWLRIQEQDFLKTAHPSTKTLQMTPQTKAEQNL